MPTKPDAKDALLEELEIRLMGVLRDVGLGNPGYALTNCALNSLRQYLQSQQPANELGLPYELKIWEIDNASPQEPRCRVYNSSGTDLGGFWSERHALNAVLACNTHDEFKAFAQYVIDTRMMNKSTVNDKAEALLAKSGVNDG